jgi:cobalt/nickel transport system permease protein
MHFLKRGSPINFLIDFYPESFGNALISGLRVVNGVVLVIIFISTTTIKEVLSVLKRLKIPDIFIEVFLIMFKYIFILNDEGLKIKNAQTVRLGYCGFRRSLESLGNLIGMIMLRGINKGSAMSEALYVRGYRGRFFYPGEISKPKFYEYFIIFFLGIIPLLLGIYFHV